LEKSLENWKKFSKLKRNFTAAYIQGELFFKRPQNLPAAYIPGNTFPSEAIAYRRNIVRKHKGSKNDHDISSKDLLSVEEDIQPM